MEVLTLGNAKHMMEHLLGMGTATAQALSSGVASSFSDIPQVESVYVSIDENVMNVSIFVNHEDDEAYYKIYDRQTEVEKREPRLCLDFRIVARRDRPMSEFVGMTSPAWDRIAEANRSH
jgi:hypothetical protein